MSSTHYKLPNLKIQAVSLSNRGNNLFRMWLITFLWRTREVHSHRTIVWCFYRHSKESTKMFLNQKLNGMYTVLLVIWSNTDIHWKYFVIIQMFWIHTHPCPHPLSSLLMAASQLPWGGPMDCLTTVNWATYNLQCSFSHDPLSLFFICTGACDYLSKVGDFATLIWAVDSSSDTLSLGYVISGAEIVSDIFGLNFCSSRRL